MRHAFFLTLIAWVGGLLPASGAEFVLEPGDERNLVRFDSRAPVESFSGTTRQVEGRLRLDPGRLEDSLAVRVVVDLASLDTGIGLRNKHMRENHLETDRFPDAIFTGVRLVEPATRVLGLNEPVTLTIQGNLSIHGVTRRIELPVTVTYGRAAEREELRIQCTFSVSLAEHKIKRPRFLVMKLSDEQQITLDLVAGREDEMGPGRMEPDGSGE